MKEETRPFNVRLPVSQLTEIKQIASEIGCLESHVFKFAVEALISLKKSSETLKLPINFTQIQDAIKEVDEFTSYKITNLDQVVKLAKLQTLQSRDKHIFPCTDTTDVDADRWDVAELDEVSSNFEVTENLSFEEVIKKDEEESSKVEALATALSNFATSSPDWIEDPEKVKALSQMLSAMIPYIEDLENRNETLLVLNKINRVKEHQEQEKIAGHKIYGDTNADIQAAAGPAIESELAEVIDWEAKDYTIDVKVCGDSMEPTFSDGEVINMHLKKKSRSPYMKVGMVYLVRYRNGLMIKEFQRRRATNKEAASEASYVYTYYNKPYVAYLKSHNPAHDDIIIDHEFEDWEAWYGECD